MSHQIINSGSTPVEYSATVSTASSTDNVGSPIDEALVHGVKLWCIPEDRRDHVPDAIYRTELIVMAPTRDEALALARAFMADALASYPDSRDWHLYEEIKEIEGAVYDVPMFGHSW